MVGPCETVALANAHDASSSDDLDLLEVDARLHAVTMPSEFRESSTKAGAKLCELLAGTEEDLASVDVRTGLRQKFATRIDAGETPGHYPVVFGVVAQSRGLPRLEASLPRLLVRDWVVGAAQRLGRFGHTEIQRVLGDLESVVVEICDRHVDDDATAMASFAPLAEIMGMRHERAGRRLFMS